MDKQERDCAYGVSHVLFEEMVVGPLCVYVDVVVVLVAVTKNNNNLKP